MANSFSVLCVHGVGHGDVDPNLRASWSRAIQDGLAAWNPKLTGAVDCEFVMYDALFDRPPQNPAAYAVAFARVLASGVVHGLGDLFSRSRGLFDIPDVVRWTAGMVAQWVSDDALRADARARILEALSEGSYDVVCAHSLGSLICYDAFTQNPAAIRGKHFVSFGSQIGNPLVRDSFAGRLMPLAQATNWYHLYNPDDHVLTADIRLSAPNFIDVGTQFDIPNDPLNHSAVCYLSHENTRATVWRGIAGGALSKTMARGVKEFAKVNAKPSRRALLVGINDYPNPGDRLEGCVNDTFLMSAMLQECGFAPEEIRMVLNERATAKGILDRLHWLLDDLQSGDERVLFYSGHGAQMRVYGPSDEIDHVNECLVPYDFDWTPEHAITDKQFVELYSQLPYDAYFVGIFDCCHAGGMTREGGRRARGLTPPDDIRHRAIYWDSALQAWRERSLPSPNPSLAESRQGVNYLGTNGATYRIGRAVGLRTLPQPAYDAIRKTLKHNGPYLPVLLEACQEGELSYEYRDGAQSFGAFTFNLAASLRKNMVAHRNPTFAQLIADVSARLKAMKYDQTPNLVGAKKILTRKIPWAGATAGGKPKTRRSAT